MLSMKWCIMIHSLQFIIHCFQFIIKFPIWFCFRKELKFLKTNMLSRAALLVPFFTTPKLVAFLMFMGFSLSGHSLASDTIFMTIGLCNAVITSMTLPFPYAIILMSTVRVTVDRLQVIKVIWRLTDVKLPYPCWQILYHWINMLVI